MAFPFSYQWWKNRENKNRQQTQITDEMRAQALETRRLNHEVNGLRKRLDLKAELAEMHSILAEGNNSKLEEKVVMRILDKIMPEDKTPAIDTEKVKSKGNMNLTDEQIKEYLVKNPHIVDEARDLAPTIGELESEIADKEPNLNADTVSRAAKIILEKAKVSA